MNEYLPAITDLGAELEKRPDGWKMVKALMMLVAESERPAQDLANALGVPPDMAEAVYQEVRERRRAAILADVRPPHVLPTRLFDWTKATAAAHRERRGRRLQAAS